MKTLEPQSILVAAKLRGEENPLLTALAELYEQGVRTISVEFSGGGDDGDINSIFYYGPRKKPMDSVKDPDDFHDELYRLLQDKVTCDWCNNDGGGGTLKFDLNTLQVKVSSYYYEQVAHECDEFEEPIRGTEEL